MALKPKNDLSREEKLAKRDAAEQDALLREVDDAVRQGDTEEFMSKYGKPLLAVLVLGLVAFGGYLFWDSRQEAAMERDGEALVGALDQVEAGNLQSGYDQLEALAAADGAAAPAAAAMMRAGIAAEQGRDEEAASLFATVAANGDAPAALRDLAKVREVAIRYDSMASDEIIAALKPLAVPGSAYFASAGELVAHAYLDQDNRAEAGALFAQIAKDESAPEGLRSRARQMAGVLGVDAIVDVDALLQEQGVTRQVGEGDAAGAAQ
ncbi:tetratricopeptide repeat protein [Qipengyuania sp. XHP0207]|uniref:tetratricopeptide repeat protein n=1 Tax=Qipengyuania sp. XHP0207 TaxID=3038078 RepID=UPI00241F6D6A|nr:tetratricopeptide repeat protein [Qipengyuania sp. XHP0207]MDG5748744.1 tetratricopeptide repeat protein [Qipengyuania sp. XHP0207]